MRFEGRLRLLLVPYAAGVIGLVVAPAALAFGLAFFHADALSPPRFAGLVNFRLAFLDELFRLSVSNTLALVLLPVPLRVGGAFLLARLLRRDGRFVWPARAVVLLPSAIPAAAFALAWLWILNPLYGPLNQLLEACGLNGPGWLADPLWAKPGVALVLLWAVAEGFLVCLAALHDVPQEVEDAAAVDGAGTWPALRHILLPLMAPVLLLLSLRDAILLLGESYTMISFLTQGGPYYATYTLPQFVNEQAFDRYAFGVASAALWALYAVTGVVVVVVLLVARAWRVGLTEEDFLL
jgi:multiple sugar transport system permease protein